MRSLGVSVPRDVQVAGFDDIPTLRDHSPSLTTYRLNLEIIGGKAAELGLLRDDAVNVHVEGRVVLREPAA